MAFQTKRVILFQTFLCSLLSISMTSQCTETAIFCLKSIKDSLEGPNNYLSDSWNFHNHTEGFICRFNGVEFWHPDENRVLNLKLSNLGLKGQFPRGIANCSSMTGLDLSANELSGPIPSDIVGYVTFIDLSDNKLTGEIPISLAKCTYLNTLKLDNNMLSGKIPQEFRLLTTLKSFSVANNHLSGPVSSFLNAEVTADGYANNSGLCGGPLAPCSIGSDRSDEFYQSFKGGLIVGYALSLTCSVLVTYSCCAPRVQLKNKKKKKKKKNSHSHLNKAKEVGKCIYSITRWMTQMVANQLHRLQHSMRVEKGSKEISVLLERLTSTICFEKLRDATDYFAIDNAIGVGRMGMMYQGSLPNGQLQAVKRVLDSQLFERQFLSEVMILGKYRHKNVVPLLGFCIEGKERLLAYTYMSNGRLSKWLHPLESEVVRLKCPERVNIALGIARGLSWLHHSCDLRVVHLNMCSECILLDENFEPKISNFGEAKFMNLHNIEGDLDMLFKVNDGKKDVYDFGSILFELITGNTYNELSRSSSATNLCGNPSFFIHAIDKSLIGKGFENEVCTLLKIACQCVHPLPNQRPTMLEVYNNMSNKIKGRHGFSEDSDTPRELEIASAISIEEIVEL